MVIIGLLRNGGNYLVSDQKPRPFHKGATANQAGRPKIASSMATFLEWLEDLLGPCPSVRDDCLDYQCHSGRRWGFPKLSCHLKNSSSKTSSSVTTHIDLVVEPLGQKIKLNLTHGW